MKRAIGALVLAGVLGLAACTSAKNNNKTMTTEAPATTQAPPSTAAPEATPTTKAPAATRAADPAHVVRAYYDAINAGDYQRAFNLGGSAFTSSYDSFVAGLNDTSHEAVTITGTHGNVVSIRLVATHDDGSTITFEGTYTVRSGKLVAANIHKVGPPPAATPKAGTPITYPDGLKVAAKYLGTRPISETACCPTRKTDVDVVVRISITAANTPIDPTGAVVSLTYGKEGNQAEDVSDSEKGINGIEGPSKLLPHHKVNGLFGFAVPPDQVNHLVLTVQPDFDHDPVTFEH